MLLAGCHSNTEWRERRLEAAAESYRLALQDGGPDTQVCFELAHVLAQAGQRQAAIERYMQAVDLKRDFADAWNNVGLLLADRNRSYAAGTAFRRALAAEPVNLRAHYNLEEVAGAVTCGQGSRRGIQQG